MAARVNITIDQGTTFSTVYDVNDEDGVAVDLSSYTANAMMRKAYSSSNAAATFATQLANGSVTISLTANQTGGIVAGRYVYDVEVVDGSGVVSRLVEGIATVTPQVTR